MPQASGDDSTRPTAMHPRRRLARRRLIEDTIETLIAYLDEADGDPDLEDEGDDEPSLGSPERTAEFGVTVIDGDRYHILSTSQIHWGDGGTMDREVEDEHDEPDGDEFDDDGLDER
ncbi:hypothetical protein [Methylobacterium nodulans]|uniref:Uncharacterized protein n=1 Tax=Methylobacterium nodulans (strain LMG 21967 / CNCM I-2342 / ORS 2060) TaxID=460265 RepID=B8IDP1_METNO|nr:hypothetical protein [Methylobacterium nodulans]ACL55613.1 hypothetical protein Mnod_0576 [Methylobacterium nodulans ORS 2060]